MMKKIPEPLKATGLFLLIILAMGVVGEMDYQDALRAEAANENLANDLRR